MKTPPGLHRRSSFRLLLQHPDTGGPRGPGGGSIMPPPLCVSCRRRKAASCRPGGSAVLHHGRGTGGRPSVSLQRTDTETPSASPSLPSGSEIHGASDRRPSAQRGQGDAEGRHGDDLRRNAGPTPPQELFTFTMTLKSIKMTHINWDQLPLSMMLPPPCLDQSCPRSVSMATAFLLVSRAGVATGRRRGGHRPQNILRFYFK
ncbi:uncharacterized protein LOC111607639 [Xiphophorus maculatus]|uniref:uncharacterized protein LOC111607639 n=1 Tax=Xiphophorus maculatus TaxID=8083 RepID=UPI000C6DB281|nr:uncharacterized protein LOC111607639 [Xiphophorus maculatus]